MNKPRYIKSAIALGLVWALLCPSIAPAETLDRDAQSGPFKLKTDDDRRLMGLTAGLGKVKTDPGLEDGELVYANAFLFWVNFSIEHQRFTERTTTNMYTGIGLGRYLQLQYGHGDEGYLLRARTEFEIFKRLTVFVGRERYRDRSEYDNYSAGFGYNF